MDAPDPVKHRPGYRLSKSDAHALRLYYTDARSSLRDGRLLLAEHNCLACHAREGTRETIPLLSPLLADKLTAVVKRYPDLAPLVPALTPPALNSIGDKLTDSALVASIARRDTPHRPYLHVRMPRFPLSDDELQTLVRHLIDTDRLPPRAMSPPPRGSVTAGPLHTRGRPARLPATASAARVVMRSATSGHRTTRSAPAGRTSRSWSGASAGRGSIVGYITRRGSCLVWRCPRCKFPSLAYSMANSTTNSTPSGTS